MSGVDPALAEKFEHRVFIEPLKRNVDNLAGCHGNTAVPKLLGNIDRYVYTGSFDPASMRLVRKP